MKKSKRLLSILLMLTMLLSMFTVMAFAEDPAFCPHKNKVHNEAFPATCTAGGMKAHYFCNDCESYLLEEDGMTVTTFDALQTSKLGHDYVDLDDAAEATCTKPGKTASKKCSRCDDIIPGTTIPATGHNYVTQDDVVEATCTQPGRTASQKCSKCGDTIEGMSTPMAPHKPVDVPETPATCTKPGITAGSECAVCHKVLSGRKVIPATGHTLVQVEGKAATCVHKGCWAHQKCLECGQLFNKLGEPWSGTTEIEKDPTNHEKLENVEAKAPTCTETGLTAGSKCSACGVVLKKQEVIPALGHKLVHVERVEPTVEKAGNIEYWYCETCGKYFLDKDAKNETTQDKVVLEKLEEEEHVLTFTIGKNGKLAYADDGREITSGRTKALKSNDKALELVATADKNHKVVWQLDNGRKHYEGSTAKITISYKDLNVKSELKVWFEEITTELDLTIKVSGFDKGDIEYKYNGGKVTDLEKREKTWSLDDKDEYVKFWLYPKTGYKAVVQLNDGKKYTYSYNESLTIDYDDLDGEDGTLYVSFVKKGSSDTDDYPTLTFDITGGKHGKVYRGTREYEHGDVISIKKNDKMTFKAKADKGYVAVWTYKGESYVGDEFTVKMGSKDAKLYVEFMDKDDIRLTELPFRDVSKRDWYYDDVVYVYRKGYMDGMSSTRFGGELNTTRGQIVTILWRLTGEPRATRNNPFNDVSSRQYYYDAISWAYDAGVVDGFDARTFKPDQNVTREQLAAILYRYAKYMNLSTSGSAYLAKYRDADKIANWAYDAMAWANYRGLINGTSATRIDPKGYATRAQIAAILHRFAVEYGA